MALLNRQIYQMGPLLRVQWQADGEDQQQVRSRGSVWLERSVLERLRTGLVPAASATQPSPCWVWTGPVDGEGKGVIYNQERTWPIHRLLYVIEFGPLSERQVLSSVCGVPRCCNPHHHRAAAHGPIPRPQVDPTRYPRCRHGHAMTPENTYVYRGKTLCRDCHVAAQARYYASTARRTRVPRTTSRNGRSSPSR